jgi:hypothetical protein
VAALSPLRPVVVANPAFDAVLLDTAEGVFYASSVMLSAAAPLLRRDRIIHAPARTHTHHSR